VAGGKDKMVGIKSNMKQESKVTTVPKLLQTACHHNLCNETCHCRTSPTSVINVKHGLIWKVSLPHASAFVADCLLEDSEVH